MLSIRALCDTTSPLELPRGLVLGCQICGIVWKVQSVLTAMMRQVKIYSLTAACVFIELVTRDV